MEKPVAGSVEITTYCNARCVMCPHTLTGVSLKPRHMPAEQVIEAVRQLVDMGCMTIIPHHLGEPTLHPDYVAIWDTIRANHPGVLLKAFTNGSLLVVKKIRECIARNANHIVVSIDGVKKETAQSTRPGLDIDRVFEGFRLLANEATGQLETQGVIIPGLNDHEMTAYSRVWRFRGADEGYPYMDVRERDSVFPNPCSRVYTQVDVRVDGTVGICCRDPKNMYPLGHMEDGIAEVWYGAKAKAFRRAHRAGEIPLCVACTWEGVYDGDPEELE